MKTKELIKAACGVANKACKYVSKHSPEILCIAGVAGGIVSTVMACKASTKVKEVIEDTETAIEAIDNGADVIEIHGTVYNVKNDCSATRFVYVRTALELAKMYGPSLAVGAMSVASIFVSNNILRKRVLTIGAAYTALDKSFKDYRERVVDRYGAEVDEELKLGIKSMKIEETVVDPETGKEKKVKKVVKVTDPNLASPWAVYVDRKCGYFDRNLDHAMLSFNGLQHYLNELLSSKGWISFNDIMHECDLPHEFRPEGQLAGISSKGPDGYVNLRAQVVKRHNEDGTIEDVIVIDPNIEGNILTTI